MIYLVKKTAKKCKIKIDYLINLLWNTFSANKRLSTTFKKKCKMHQVSIPTN